MKRSFRRTDEPTADPLIHANERPIVVRVLPHSTRTVVELCERPFLEQELQGEIQSKPWAPTTDVRRAADLTAAVAFGLPEVCDLVVDDALDNADVRQIG